MGRYLACWGPMDQAKPQINIVSGLSRPEGPLYWLTTLVIRMLIAPANVGIGVAIGSSAHRFQRVTAIGITLSIDLFPEWWHYCGCILPPSSRQLPILFLPSMELMHCRRHPFIAQQKA